MKKKIKKPTKRIANKQQHERLSHLAERLFDIGMEGWRKADSKRPQMKFSEIESPGQIAGWYAIAMYVESVMHPPF